MVKNLFCHFSRQLWFLGKVFTFVISRIHWKKNFDLEIQGQGQFFTSGRRCRIPQTNFSFHFVPTEQLEDREHSAKNFFEIAELCEKTRVKRTRYERGMNCAVRVIIARRISLEPDVSRKRVQRLYIGRHDFSRKAGRYARSVHHGAGKGVKQAEVDRSQHLSVYEIPINETKSLPIYLTVLFLATLSSSSSLSPRPTPCSLSATLISLGSTILEVDTSPFVVCPKPFVLLVWYIYWPSSQPRSLPRNRGGRAKGIFPL